MQVVVLVDAAFNVDHRRWLANHVLYKTRVTYLKVRTRLPAPQTQLT